MTWNENRKPEDAISTQSGSQRRGAQTSQGRHTYTRTHGHTHTHTSTVQTQKNSSALWWIYTRSCIRKQQSQQAQFDITEQLKLQMTNPLRDWTDIKHPKQLQQLQTFTGLALRLMSHHSEARGCQWLLSLWAVGKARSHFVSLLNLKRGSARRCPSLSGNRDRSGDQASVLVERKHRAAQSRLLSHKL